MTSGATRRGTRRNTAGPAALLIILLASAATPAGAQQPAITPVPAYAVAVASDPGAQSATAGLQQAGLQALSVTAPFVLVQYGGGAVTPPPPVSLPDQPLMDQAAGVTRSLEAGRQAMTNLELDTAAARFGEVQGMYEAAPGLSFYAGTQPFAEALINLGINAMLAGDDAATRDYFGYAASIDPTVMPDAELFPDAIAVYDQVIGEIGSRSLARVDVNVDPEGAEVWVDGVQKGPAPQRVDLAPGKHLFAARADGYVSSGAIVDVRAGRRPTDVSIMLEASAGAAAPAGPPQPNGVADLPAALMEGSGREMALYRSICDQVGARILLMLWIMPTGGPTSMISIQLYDRLADRIIGAGLSPEVPVSAAQTGPAALESVKQVLEIPARTLIAEMGPPPPIEPPPIEPPPNGEDDGEFSIVEAWWFWTIIGAVVAGGAATGIYFGVTAGGGPSGPDAPQIILEF
ncbi:MAG: PEGA domain-containing protein [Deltaproteobacteria bacterium]|nr:PEGA domain-containing protein [Deltaproteobacteria bacterium]